MTENRATSLSAIGYNIGIRCHLQCQLLFTCSYQELLHAPHLCALLLMYLCVSLRSLGCIPMLPASRSYWEHINRLRRQRRGAGQYLGLAEQLGRFHAAFWTATGALSHLRWL